MWNQAYKNIDLESGAIPLLPVKHESPQLSWSFIPKDYSIMAMQLLATIVIDAVMIIVPPNSTWYFTSGSVEAIILIAVVVTTLILFTFWATRRGQDINFLSPFMFGALQVLAVFGLILVFFPMGELCTMIFRCMAAINFCGYLVFYPVILIKISNEYI